MTLGGPVGSGGGEVVLIEFLADAKSAVAASEETVAGLDAVTAAAERAGEAQAAAAKEAGAAGRQSKVAAAESASASRKQAAAAEESTAATDASAAATRRAASASKEASAAAIGTSAAWKKNSSAMVGVGRGLTKYVSLPLIGVGAVATKMSLDFSKAMLLIETHTDTSRKMVERYRKSILAMSASGQYTQGPKELSEAMYHIASDGYKGAKALQTLRESAHLATLGQSNLAETTYALVSAEKTGIKGTHDMHEAIGLLNGIVGAGDMKMQDLVGAMSTGILPAAKSVGLSLRDVGASLDVMTQRGIPAQQAAYRLSMNFQQLVPYTEKAQGAFEQLGLGQYQLAEAVKGPKGYLSALELLQEHLDRFNKYQQGTLIREIFGGGRTSRGMLTLLQNLGSMEHAYESINRLSGETNKNLSTALKSPANVWAKEWAKLQTVMVKLGDQLVPVVIPALKEVAGDVADLVGAFNSLPPGAQEWAVKLGVVAIALGPILGTIGKIGKLVTTIAGTSLFGGAAAEAEAAAAGAGAAGAGGAASGAAGVGLGATLAGVARVAGPPAVAAYAANKIAAPTSHKTGFFQSFGEGFTAIPRGIYSAVAGGTDTKVGHLVGKPFAAQYRKQFQAAMTGIDLDALVGLKKLNQDLGTGLQEAGKAWKVGTAPWREHVIEAMRESVASIRQGMHNGTIATGRGQKEINNLLGKIHLMTGKDPLGVAEGAVTSFKKAHAVTQAGVKELDHDLGKMPKGAREAAINSTLEMANAWAKGHPKIEAQVDTLRRNLARKFGKTNAQMVGGVKTAVQGIAGLFGELGESVSEALGDLSDNVNTVLKAMGVSKDVHVVLETGKAAGKVIGAAAETIKGVHIPGFGQATGGLTRVPGKGRQDTVPLYANGAMSAVVAPGEDLAVINRHQRPLLDHAVSAAFPGTRGLGDFFAKNNTPHYMAKGGLHEPRISGAGRLSEMGQAGIHKAFLAAEKYVKAHRPAPGGLYGGPTPPGVGSFDGKPVDKWIIPILAWAMKHGWHGTVTSGWRSEAEQAYLYAHPQGYPVAAPGTSNHEKTAYPGGAVDVTSPEVLARVLKGYHHQPRLVWGPEGGNQDAVHFSATGRARGGFLDRLKKFAGGGVVGTAGTVLLRHGLDPVAAAGIMGNSYGESGWDPSAMEPGTHNGGLFGFTAGDKSLASEQAFAQRQGKPWTDVATQVQFMLTTLSGGLKNKLNAMTSTDDTTSAFMHEWEAPENYSSLGKRQSAAKRALGVIEKLSGSGHKGESVAKQIRGTYGPKKGSTGPGGGTNAPPRRYKVTTEALSFGSLPTTLRACRHELTERRRQLAEYRGAIADSKKDPKTRQALIVNEKALKHRIAQLVKQKARLAAQALKEKQVQKIQGRGIFPGIDQLIKTKERDYNVAAQYAEQVASLEPEEGPAAVDYMKTKEAPAWLSVLGAEASWRNAVLGAEEVAGARLVSLQGQVEGISALRKTNPKAFAKAKFKLPALNAAIAAVKSVFTPAQAKSFKDLRKGQYTAASGEYPQILENLQGPEGFAGDHLKVAQLPVNPTPGLYGGLIWDTQMALRELGISEANAGSDGEGNAALIEALKQTAERADRGKAIAEAQYGPFAEFLKKMPPYIGAFATGGDIPGPVGRAYTATVHGGETIVPAGAASAPDVHLHLHGDMATALEAKMPGIVKVVERSIGRNYRHLVFGPGGGR